MTGEGWRKFWTGKMWGVDLNVILDQVSIEMQA